MKNLLLFFIFHFLFSILSAQETTTSITRSSDSTFVQVNVTAYTDGRTVTEQVPYTLDEFADLIVDQNISSLVRIDELEQARAAAQRDVNQLKRYLVDSLGIDYDSLLSLELLTALNGDWKLIERNGGNTVTNVSIAANQNNSAVLRMTNEDGPGGWNLKPVHTQKFEVRGHDIGGSPEDIVLQLTQFGSFTGYRGRASDGTVFILRR